MNSSMPLAGLDSRTGVGTFGIPPELALDFEAFKATLSPEEQRALTVLAAGMKHQSAEEFIGNIPETEILNAHERRVFAAEMAREVTEKRSPSAKFVMVLKATRLCNLRCTYCRSWAEGPNQVMSFPVLVRAIREVLSMRGLQHVEIVWHGGEITLLKPKFFKKLIWVQQQFRRPGQVIRISLQTNATHLTDEWIEFLSTLNIGVGISIDGPPEVHDRRRVDKDGKPSSPLVVEGIRRLRTAGIPHGALVVVDRFLQDIGAERLLKYFHEIGLKNLDFLNIVPENHKGATASREDGFICFDEYVDFLREAFDVWWRKYRDEMFITTFADLIPALRDGAKPNNCYWAGNCMVSTLTIEANGDMAPCDKFIDDEGSIFGNVMRQSIADVMRQTAYIKNANRERASSLSRMKTCDFFQICQGGCPHDRLVNRRHVPDHDPDCCGLKPLVRHIRDAAMA